MLAKTSMRKVGLKPGGDVNKVAPFRTPSAKTVLALEQLLLSVILGAKFRVWGPCAQAVRERFDE